jgi:teichoic acid transport system ATP-binding protein
VSGPTTTVTVHDLHVEYEIFEDRRAALRERLIERRGTGRSVVHALKGVSFDLRQGESVGIIGSNGSGKSTLLAALAGLLPPTAGEILVTSEPTMFGVGSALLPAATGLRNIRLGCLALGLPAEELDDMVVEIAEFTGLGAALHRPLRTYSAGMKARVHFAIATSVKPEILLIDEGLAVGDRRFRERANQRIHALIESAGTFVLVSHNQKEMVDLCTRAIWIEQGVLIDDGPVEEILDRYHEVA